MSKIYLFDWGDTLMIDFPDQEGKMYNWTKVEAVKDALQTLQTISSHSSIYIATNAADSTETEIEAAFRRVGLSSFISGYFCKANLGVGKGNKEFYHKIADALGTAPSDIIMIGDNFKNDIAPAIEAGLHAIWFNSEGDKSSTVRCKQIRGLIELCA